MMGDSLQAWVDVCEIAEGYDIPPEKQAAFCTDLMKAIKAAHRLGAEWRRPQLQAWLGPITEQAAALRDSLRRLSVDEHGAVAAPAGFNSLTFVFSFLGPLDALAKQGKELVAREEAIATSKPPGQPGPRKKPAPGEPGAPAPEEFVAEVYRLIVRDGGKRPTYGWDSIEEKPTGTLHRTLDLLRPHLPGGFLDGLTVKVLRNLIATLKVV